jgi:peroxiredoxin
MTKARFLDVGDALPEISLPDLSGNAVEFSSFTDKKLIVFMWASW